MRNTGTGKNWSHVMFFLIAAVLLACTSRARGAQNGGNTAAVALTECRLQLAEHKENKYKTALTKARTARKLAHYGQAQRAAEVLTDVQKIADNLPSALQLLVWNEMARAYAAMGRYEKALSLADRKAMKKNDVTVLTRKEIAVAMFRAGKRERGLGVLRVAHKHMSEMEEGPGKFRSKLAWAYANGGYYREALELAVETTSFRLKTTTLSWIAHPGRNPHADNAPKEVLWALLDIADHIANPEKSRALRDIAEAFARAGDVERALQICDEIPETHKRIRARVNIAESLMDRGKSKRALTLLDEVSEEEKGEMPYPVKITGLYARLGRYRKALELAGNARRTLETVEALAWVARARAENGQMDRGDRILTEAVERALEEEEAFSRNHNLQVVAVTWAGALRQNRDRRILHRTLEIASRMDGLFARTETLKKLADICHETEMSLDERARELLEEVRAYSPPEKKDGSETGAKSAQ